MLLVLTVADLTALSCPEHFGYGPALIANNLTEEPDNYIPLTNPDSYLLQAINDPGSAAFIGSWQNTQFDEMFQTYGTDRVEFNGNYYVIQILYVDAFGYTTFFWLLMIGWGTFTISVISTRMRKQPQIPAPENAVIAQPFSDTSLCCF